MPRENAKVHKYVNPEELLAKYRAGATYSGTVQFRDGSVDFRILTRDEEMDIRRRAVDYAKKYGGDSTEKNDFVQKYTLSLATNIDGQPQLPISIFTKFTTDEIDYLYDEYIRIRESFNPSIEVMTPDQFNAICDGLKKKAVGPKDLSLPQLKAICSAFADIIREQAART